MTKAINTLEILSRENRIAANGIALTSAEKEFEANGLSVSYMLKQTHKAVKDVVNLVVIFKDRFDKITKVTSRARYNKISLMSANWLDIRESVQGDAAQLCVVNAIINKLKNV